MPKKKTNGELDLTGQTGRAENKTKNSLFHKHRRSVHRFPRTDTRHKLVAAGVLLGWIDEKYKIDNLANLDLSPHLAASILARNPPSVLLSDDSVCIDGDVLRTYSLLKRLPVNYEVFVHYVDQSDPLAGLNINTSEIFSSSQSLVQVHELATICELNETLKNPSAPKRVKNLMLAAQTGLSEGRISTLLKTPYDPKS